MSKPITPAYDVWDIIENRLSWGVSMDKVKHLEDLYDTISLKHSNRLYYIKKILEKSPDSDYDAIRILLESAVGDEKFVFGLDHQLYVID